MTHRTRTSLVIAGATLLAFTALADIAKEEGAKHEKDRAESECCLVALKCIVASAINHRGCSDVAQNVPGEGGRKGLRQYHGDVPDSHVLARVVLVRKDIAGERPIDTKVGAIPYAI